MIPNPHTPCSFPRVSVYYKNDKQTEEPDWVYPFSPTSFVTNQRVVSYQLVG